jgi:predicted transcriptional regulator
MEFETAAKLGALLSKSYAQPMFELLVTYRDISASEAASRLNLHIRTVQDFLESLTELGVTSRMEVRENKRPYFRYSLEKQHIQIDLDLNSIQREQEQDELSRRIRERARSGARFVTARGDNAISSVTIWTGNGRDRTERKINLSGPQGKFLFHLPFPDADALTITEIMQKANIDHTLAPEILDLIDILKQHQVIDVLQR